MAIEKPSLSTILMVVAVAVIVVPMVVTRGCDPGDPFEEIEPPFAHDEKRMADTGAREICFQFPLPPVRVSLQKTVPPEAINAILTSIGLVPVTSSGVNCASHFGQWPEGRLWRDRYQWEQYPGGPLTVCLKTTQWPPYADRGIIKEYSGVRFIVVGDLGFKRSLANARSRHGREDELKGRNRKK